jgi:hypothetical protein
LFLISWRLQDVYPVQQPESVDVSHNHVWSHQKDNELFDVDLYEGTLEAVASACVFAALDGSAIDSETPVYVLWFLTRDPCLTISGVSVAFCPRDLHNIWCTFIVPVLDPSRYRISIATRLQIKVHNRSALPPHSGWTCVFLTSALVWGGH